MTNGNRLAGPDGFERVVEEKLFGLLDRGEQRSVIDCAPLDDISSAGLRVFLMAAKRLNAGHRESDAGGAQPC